MNNQPLLEDLRLFCVVVKNRSFVATATELGVSPAYVSKRIAILESSLNTKLLHRTTRKVAVTDDGTTIYEWSQRILEDVDQMTEMVLTTKTTPRGLLRICTSSGFGRNRVGPALSRLATLYPSMEIQLELLDRPVDLIGEGFDLDIRVGTVNESSLIAKHIATNYRILTASPQYIERHGSPTSLADLANHQCIVIRERDQTSSVWRVTGPNGPVTVRVAGPLSTNNGEIAHQWAIEGHGILLRSIWDVQASMDSGRLLRVLPDHAQEANVWAVYTSRLSSSAKVRVCVQFLEQWLKN
ncbi:LysR substrate-binding domain-containing protein [Pollutimonas thiosulfatoxidans]|uniref:LysR family transcriptional regulator n=1 Tax=Pollutimonas thiosulfatoxidans TaxID=2028345 RepID=A0A410GE52_9BURK|nr:LysR substrate-binding domain-containing protein [Pollutimonas thiosulfatoxidans]QAA94586.1 LysR family transcriptional regulator [Pollutimonas thiosulfatoxidans]